jgi:hypothetical protein
MTKNPMKMKIDVEVFEASFPMQPGFYWRSEECKLLRGPFPTGEEAKSDALCIGQQLVGIILVPDELPRRAREDGAIEEAKPSTVRRQR